MDDLSTSETQLQARAFQQAQQAANTNDPIGVLVALRRERVLDGLVRRLGFSWQQLPSHIIEDLVTQAVEELFAHVEQNKPVTSIVGFLYNRASWRAYDYFHGEFKVVKSYSPDALALKADLDGGHKDDYSFEDEVDDEQRQQLFRKAREVVPHVGEENIQKTVMYLLDALEAGRTTVPNQEIADVLGMSLASAKSLKSRAIKRFEDRAPKFGLPAFYVAELQGEEDEEDDAKE